MSYTFNIANSYPQLHPDGTPHGYIQEKMPEGFKRKNGNIYTYKTLITKNGYKENLYVNIEHPLNSRKKTKLIDKEWFLEYFKKTYGIQLANYNLGTRFHKRDRIYYQFISFIDIGSPRNFDIIEFNHLKIKRKEKLKHIF